MSAIFIMSGQRIISRKGSIIDRGYINIAGDNRGYSYRNPLPGCFFTA
ncbi:hypothetical protein CSB69_1726 [Morganella morganii]|nr:hypothetical protein CSB69_1726 [Morganella morganii]